MRVAIGSDHGGFRLKQVVTAYLREQGREFHDFGTFDETAVDYPDYARLVARAVATREFERGILICGTGIGVAIAANKVAGVRAALCHDCFSAAAARAHNDANILTLGERVVGAGLALEIVRIFLDTSFDGGRHARRLAKIHDLEKEFNVGC